MTEIILEGGAKVSADLSKRCFCKCGKEFVWAKTQNNKPMPIVINAKGRWYSHFADCPQAGKFRRG